MLRFLWNIFWEKSIKYYKKYKYDGRILKIYVVLFYHIDVSWRQLHVGRKTSFEFAYYTFTRSAL